MIQIARIAGTVVMRRVRRVQVPIHGDGRAGYGTGSQTVIVSLKADDRVWIQLSKDSALLNDYTTFSGYLIFED